MKYAYQKFHNQKRQPPPAAKQAEGKREHEFGT